MSGNARAFRANADDAFVPVGVFGKLDVAGSVPARTTGLVGALDRAPVRAVLGVLVETLLRDVTLAGRVGALDGRTHTDFCGHCIRNRKVTKRRTKRAFGQFDKKSV